MQWKKSRESLKSGNETFINNYSCEFDIIKCSIYILELPLCLNLSIFEAVKFRQEFKKVIQIYKCPRAVEGGKLRKI